VGNENPLEQRLMRSRSLVSLFPLQSLCRSVNFRDYRLVSMPTTDVSKPQCPDRPSERGWAGARRWSQFHVTVQFDHSSDKDSVEPRHGANRHRSSVLHDSAGNGGSHSGWGYYSSSTDFLSSSASAPGKIRKSST
jgi:hypothetical protein